VADQEDAGVHPQEASRIMTHRMPVQQPTTVQEDPKTFQTKPSVLANVLFFAALLASLAFVAVMVAHGVQSHPGSLLDDLSHGTLIPWIKSL
jgi:hypothetical protein